MNEIVVRHLPHTIRQLSMHACIVQTNDIRVYRHARTHTPPATNLNGAINWPRCHWPNGVKSCVQLTPPKWISFDCVENVQFSSQFQYGPVLYLADVSHLFIEISAICGTIYATQIVLTDHRYYYLFFIFCEQFFRDRRSKLAYVCEVWPWNTQIKFLVIDSDKNCLRLDSLRNDRGTPYWIKPARDRMKY